MSLSVDKESQNRRKDLISYSPPAPSPRPAIESQPATGFMSLQSGIGNSALANSVSNASFALSSSGSQFQSAYGNAAVALEAASPNSSPSPEPLVPETPVAQAAPTASLLTASKAQAIAPEPAVAYPAPEKLSLGASKDASAEQAAESLGKDEEKTSSADDAQPPAAATKPAAVSAIGARPVTVPTGASEPEAGTKQAGATAAVEAKAATEARPDAKAQTGSTAQAAAKGEAAAKPKAGAKAIAEGESAAEAGPEEATEATGSTASSDPDFQAVVNRTRNAAARARSHAPANTKASQAQAAAVGPPNDAKSQAAGAQVQKMDQQQAQPFNRAMLKAALLKKITDTAPATLKDADEFKKGGKLNSVKGDLTKTVKEGKQQAQGNIAETTTQAPDTSTAHPKTVTPLSPTNAGPPPPDIGAAQAIPKAKSESEVSLQEGSTSLDQQMADANVTEEQLQESNEPSFTGALETKNSAQADAASAPLAYREEEQAVLEGARGDVTATAQAQLRGMHGGRAQALAQVVGLQGGAKGQDEQERANVASHIEDLYNQTRKGVEDRLQKLDEDVNKSFDEGAANAQKAFEDYVDVRVTNYKINRYLQTPGGSLLWAKDLLLGLPDDVNQIYLAGSELYIGQMDGLLGQIAGILETGLTEAKALIKSGKQEIEKYVIGLSPSLRGVGRKAAQSIQSKFDALEQSVDDKQNQLTESLRQKYNESLQQIDDRVKTMQEENRGLVDKAREALAGVFETILKLKNMLLNTLARVADAVTMIIAHPIDFLGNLVAGVRLGFDNFTAKIEHYLEQALVEWIFGELGDTGIQMPETFDLKGILSLVMQVLGLTYANIRARAVGLLGEKVVAGLETTAEIFKILITEGPAGLWEHIKDQVGDLKSMVIEQIKSFVEEKIIKAGIMWLIGLLNPVSAFIKACKGIYDIIMFFVDHAAQIMALVNAIIDSVTEIAKGNIAGAAAFVEKALAKGLTVVIGFLAALLGLSGIGEKIKSIIEMIRKPINKAIDWVITKAVGLVKSLGQMLGFGKEEKAADTAPGDHGAIAAEVVDKLRQPPEKVENYSKLRQEKEEQARQLEIAYIAKLEPGIKLSIRFAEASKDIDDNDLDFEVLIAPNDEKATGSIMVGGYPVPVVGAYSELVNYKDQPLPDGKIREAHHTPAVELAISLEAAMVSAGTELLKDGSKDKDLREKNVTAGKAMLDAAENLRTAADGHGQDLPAIRIHQDTHRIRGGAGARIHGSEIRAELEKSLESRGINLSHVPVTAGGEIAVKPTGEVYGRQLKAISKEKAGDASDVKEALKIAGPAIVKAAYDAEAERALSAVEIGVRNSKVDGPDDQKETPLKQLRDLAHREWGKLLAPLFK